MAWNEPGNRGNNPWGGPPSGRNEWQELINKLGGLFGGGNAAQEPPAGKLIVLVVATLLALWAVLGVYQLDEQKRAVVLRLGAFHTIVGSGVHWNPPFIDTVVKENVTQQRSYTTQGAMLTEDENIVEVQLSVQYNIGDLKQFVLSIREPERALAEATDSTLRHAIGSSKMDDVLTIGRAQVEMDVRERLQRYLDAYQTGIAITKVNVEKTQPPSAVQAAFDDVIKAREDEQRVQNEAQTYVNTVVPEARGLAKRVHEEALAYRDRVIARAQGEATRFEALLAEYRKAPEVTRERLYLETMQDIYARNNKVFIDVAQGSGNMLYLPLDKLSPRNNSSTAAVTANSLSQTELDALASKLESRINREPTPSGRAAGRREIR